MSPRGNVATLEASQPGNLNAAKRGIYSRTGRVLEPRVRALVDEIMALPHTVDVDELGAVEIARLTALVEAVDDDLAERGLTNRRTGDVRQMADLRLRASRRLQEWLGVYGLTPQGRASWAATLAQGGLGAEIAKRRAGTSG